MASAFRRSSSVLRQQIRDSRVQQLFSTFSKAHSSTTALPLARSLGARLERRINSKHAPRRWIVVCARVRRRALVSEAGNASNDETKPRHRYGPARFVGDGHSHHHARAAVPRRLPPPASVREGVGSLRLCATTTISLVEEDPIALMPNLGGDRLLSCRM